MPAVAETTWSRGVVSPPFYLSIVRLRPLTFGQVILLSKFKLIEPLTMRHLTRALHLISQPNFKAAVDSIEFWHWRLLFNPRRLWVLIKRVLFQYWHALFLYRLRNVWAEIWKMYVKESTEFPITMECEGVDRLGLGPHGVVRGVLLQSGLYTSDNIMDSTLIQVLHDYNWVRGVRVENKRDVAITEALKKAEKKEKDNGEGNSNRRFDFESGRGHTSI